MITFSQNHTTDSALRSTLKTSIEKMISEKEWGFSRVPHQEESWELAQFVGKKLRSEFERLVVIGMGGSSLGAKAIQEALAPEAPVIFWNSSDPHTISKSLKDLGDLSKTHWLVISKSGSTLETISLMNLAVQTLKTQGLEYSNHVSLITEDKSSLLHDFAKANNLPTYPHPMDVGGRFSVFTVVGMIPTAFAGVNVNELRQGALEMEKDVDLIADLSATALTSFSNQQWSTILWPYYDRLQSFCDWTVQLWSESLGKAVTRDKQPAPQASYPSNCLGARDQHSILQQLAEGAKDKWVLFFKVNDHGIPEMNLMEEGAIFPEMIQGTSLNKICNIQADATYEALIADKATTDRLEFEKFTAREMGALLYLFEWVVTAIGEQMNIDVFDQPGVEAGKILTKQKLQSH